MQQLIYFLLTYQNYIFLAMFALLTVVALVNFTHNPYAKQNTKLKRFNKKIVKTPSSIISATKHLPQEYQRQWRAFVNSGCSKPSIVFEFVKQTNKYLLWFVHLLCALLSVAYVVLALVFDQPQIFTLQVAFMLSSALVLLVNSLICQINLSQARRVFGRFLHDLNTVTDIVKVGKRHVEQGPKLPDGGAGCAPLQPQDLPNLPQSALNPLPQQQPSPDVADGCPAHPATQQVVPQLGTDQQVVVEPYAPQADSQQTTIQSQQNDALLDDNQIESCDNQSVIDKAVIALRQKGLTNPRTVEEQRKLNVALNNLLQACCKHSS